MPTRREVDEALKILPVPRPTLQGLSLAQAEEALGVWKAAVRQVHRDLIRQAHPDVAGPSSADRARQLNDARSVLLSVSVRRKLPPPPSPPPPPPRPSTAPWEPSAWRERPQPRWEQSSAALTALALSVARRDVPVLSRWYHSPRFVVIGRLW